MDELIARAVKIGLETGSERDIWLALSDEYAQYGDPSEIHAKVLEEANKQITSQYDK